ncbi:GNAT family N-acetyltransferase [Spartinivicinus poritis]|uniref:GNAT family N-acetyltransferase n=1 Tax=Spartinivicinus poritis TaxID=2994640 RepID=A0ABT5U5N1_9GAMM|nr:GNAT family N-acetyltransferase [Spartinivicinus sp. A2-2]MDE1461666.1 GNAT family N-acetyltransferase [Spartinivicinus sp. A2-2]
MKIVAVDKTEYIEIVNVWEASVRATHEFLTEADIKFFKPKILNEYLQAVENLWCVKNRQEHIIGFVGVADDNIEMLFISPGNRGKGIGKLLTSYAVEQLGANKVDVNEQNTQAVGFYERLGFKVVSRSEVDGLGKPYPLLHMQL